MAQSLTSFTNQNWVFSSAGSSVNTFPKAGMDIEIYDNSQYDTYVTFLNGSEASTKIDEDVSYLTQQTLTDFKAVIA